jgi:hypothetical protein
VEDGTVSLADLKGGTFTITNGGAFGSLLSTHSEPAAGRHPWAAQTQMTRAVQVREREVPWRQDCGVAAFVAACSHRSRGVKWTPVLEPNNEILQHAHHSHFQLQRRKTTPTLWSSDLQT